MGVDGRAGMIVGALLCGGRSSRFGSDKALADADGVQVGERVINAMRAGGAEPVVAIGGTAGSELGVPTVDDLRPGEGPLGGLATALLYYKTGWVLVAPCDLVLLQPSHVSSLIAGLTKDRDARAVVATVDGKPQVSLALWPASRGRDLLAMVDSGARKFRAALDEIGWVGVELPPEAVSDADTPEELARLLAERAQ